MPLTTEIMMTCRDGFTLAGTLAQTDAPAKASLVICSALGVPRRYYRRYAAYLADNGYRTLIFDYRGIGDSVLDADTEIRMSLWGEQDIDAALRYARTSAPETPLFMLGHSCGGQLFGLTPESTGLAGAIFVGASMAYWSRWPTPLNIGALGLWYGFLPLFNWRRTRFPARALGISSVDVPAPVIAEWITWARRPEYLFYEKFGLDTAGYADLSFPLLSLGFTDDRYAPRKAIQALLARFPSAQIDDRTIKPQHGKIGHFGFFKPALKDSLWRDTLRWLEKHSSSN